MYFKLYGVYFEPKSVLWYEHWLGVGPCPRNDRTLYHMDAHGSLDANRLLSQILKRSKYFFLPYPQIRRQSIGLKVLWNAIIVAFYSISLHDLVTLSLSAGFQQWILAKLTIFYVVCMARYLNKVSGNWKGIIKRQYTKFLFMNLEWVVYIGVS